MKFVTRLSYLFKCRWRIGLNEFAPKYFKYMNLSAVFVMKTQNIKLKKKRFLSFNKTGVKTCVVSKYFLTISIFCSVDFRGQHARAGGDFPC